MTPSRALGAGLLLTGVAGFVDAVGFITLGGYYTSFMSGNTTQLGADLAAGHWQSVGLPAALVALFFLGSVTGALLAQSNRRWGPATTLALVVLGIGGTLLLRAGGVEVVFAMLPLAFAAGAQNAVLQPIGAARLGATFVTGTLFAAGQDLARAIAGEAPPLRWLQHLLVWAALCLGALLGALAFGRWQVDSLLIPVAAYFGAALWFATVAPKSPENKSPA
jgi:uncharacterized membrane protein YoaK (UPF0700 family)